MIPAATSFTSATVATTEYDGVSELSFGTFRMPPTTQALVVAVEDKGIPQTICITIKTTENKENQHPSPVVAVASLEDRPLRKHPRGRVHPYAIGNLVGQSSLVVPNGKLSLEGSHSATASTTTTSHNNSITCPTDFMQTRRANRKLDALVAEQRRRSSNLFLGEMLYALEERVTKPVQRLRPRLYRHSCSTYDLHPSQHGCMA